MTYQSVWAWRFAAISGVAGLLVGTANGVSAQDRPGVLEEVLVTATHREASVQDIPFSMTALSEEAMERAVADNLEDIAVTVAGMEFASFAPGLNRVTFRGISTQTGESSTGFYIDEMPVTADPTAQPDVKAFDINRVEVLRGPQGTLFGEAALGGLVRIIMNQPDASQFDAAVRATVSNTAHGGFNYGVDGMLNVPLVEDKLALRIVASERSDEGFIDNLSTAREDVNANDSTNVRATLDWQVSDALTVSLTAQYSDLQSDGEFISDEDWEQRKPYQGFREDEYSRWNLTVNYQLSWADLLSSTSKFDRETSRADDVTTTLAMFAPFPVPAANQSFEIEYDIFVQEFRLTSNSDGKLDWVAGAFYKDSERDLVGNVAVPGFIEVGILDSDNQFTFEQWALYGELGYQLSDSVRVVAGLRYFEEENSLSLLTSGVFAGPFPFASTVDAEASELTPRFSISWDLREDWMLYATASKGFRTGGVNATKPIFDLLGVPVEVSFDPDTLWNYELGSKAVLADGRVTVNAALYWMEWSDIQLPVPAVGGPAFNATTNAGEATSQGVELELSYQASERLRIDFSGNYTDATLDENQFVPVPVQVGPTDFVNVDVPIAIEGNELPLVPQWKASLAVEYTAPLGRDGWELIAGGSASWVAERFNFADNNPAEVLSEYNLVDLRVGIQNDKYQLILFAKNLTDEVVEYAFLGDPAFPSERYFAPGTPRTLGLTAKVNF